MRIRQAKKQDEPLTHSTMLAVVKLKLKIEGFMSKEKIDYKELNKELCEELKQLKEQNKEREIYVQRASNITKENNLLHEEIRLLKIQARNKDSEIANFSYLNDELITTKNDLFRYKQVVKSLLGDLD